MHPLVTEQLARWRARDLRASARRARWVRAAKARRSGATTGRPCDG